MIAGVSTLMRLATGFCDSFLNSSAFVAAAGVACVATLVPAGPTGVSCANSGTDKKRTSCSPDNAGPALCINFYERPLSIFHIAKDTTHSALFTKLRRTLEHLPMLRLESSASNCHYCQVICASVKIDVDAPRPQGGQIVVICGRKDDTSGSLMGSRWSCPTPEDVKWRFTSPIRRLPTYLV